MIEKAQSSLQIITVHITVHAILCAQDLKLKAAEQKSLIDFIESCVEKMQPQLEDNVSPKSESRYRATQSVTRFSYVKLPKPAGALQWQPWFCSLVLCAFRRKRTEAWGFNSPEEWRLIDVTASVILS